MALSGGLFSPVAKQRLIAVQRWPFFSEKRILKDSRKPDLAALRRRGLCKLVNLAFLDGPLQNAAGPFNLRLFEKLESFSDIGQAMLSIPGKLLAQRIQRFPVWKQGERESPWPKLHARRICCCSGCTQTHCEQSLSRQRQRGKQRVSQRSLATIERTRSCQAVCLSGQLWQLHSKEGPRLWLRQVAWRYDCNRNP